MLEIKRDLSYGSELARIQTYMYTVLTGGGG